jgi:hypothetical protein
MPATGLREAIMRSIHRFLARHFSLENLAKRLVKVYDRSNVQPHPANDAGFRGAIAVLNQGRERDVRYAIRRPQLCENIGVDRQNIGRVGDPNHDISELNRFGTLSHRSFFLFVDENGQAYALDGSKWSPSGRGMDF